MKQHTLAVFLIVFVFFILADLSAGNPKAHGESGANGEPEGVLGRTKKVAALSDDFDDTGRSWKPDAEGGVSGPWRASRRGAPTGMKRVEPPEGGPAGSTGALRLQTKKGADEESIQDDLINPGFASRLGRPLGPPEQPVVIVRVWLPPFPEWTPDFHNFGFRLGASSETLVGPGNANGSYYPSIWLADVSSNAAGRERAPRWYTRIGSGIVPDENVGPIPGAGWWTLAIAFDHEGIGHYYVRPGVQPPTEEDRIWKTTDFPANKGRGPTMDAIDYGFFSILAPPDGSASAEFIVDGYEVWIRPPEKTGEE